MSKKIFIFAKTNIMKTRIFFMLFLFPLMVFSQYYVGRAKGFTPIQFDRLAYFRTKVNADGSMYIYWTNKMNKLLPNGMIDSSFGINGTVNVGVYSSYGTDILANDQGIYLFLNNKIVKYNFAGALDISYGVNGVVTFSQNVSAVFLNSDSSLYFSSNNKIQKLLSDGQIDSSVNINVPADNFYFVNNNFYVFRTQYPAVYVTKYSLDGVQDLTYGNMGILEESGNYKIDPSSGNIYVFLPTAIKRYTSAGVLDPTFGIGGTVLGSFPQGVKSISVDSNNNILFFGGGQGYGYNQAIIYRLKNNGEEDNTFNNGSYKYNISQGMISKAHLLDDNTYICMDDTRASLSAFLDGTKKYIRTQDTSLIIDDALNVNDVNNSNIDKFKVYPNPTTDDIHIEVENNEKINKVNIYTITGDFILSDNKAEMNVKHLVSGNYIIEIITDNKIYKTKFIKK